MNPSPLSIRSYEVTGSGPVHSGKEAAALLWLKE